ncbi:unnamed protein product [Didymodactylos carnosus]|uniref:Uncharacterized protein n=1 Tax=Didymodactylos carnosus TaxID=1234261 RepID=A0A8S2FEV7_9BILA|nr:unnamed protein product [Didymodactylos carnosus]CAF4242202.1 unnamed protein product [Didymodactylos carnosus]
MCEIPNVPDQYMRAPAWCTCTAVKIVLDMPFRKKQLFTAKQAADIFRDDDDDDDSDSESLQVVDILPQSADDSDFPDDGDDDDECVPKDASEIAGKLFY